MLDRLDHSRRRAAELKAERDRRRKVRLKAGKACYTIEADAALLDMMVKLHWLSERELMDRRAVERALGDMLAASART